MSSVALSVVPLIMASLHRIFAAWSLRSFPCWRILQSDSHWQVCIDVMAIIHRCWCMYVHTYVHCYVHCYRFDSILGQEHPCRNSTMSLPPVTIIVCMRQKGRFVIPFRWFRLMRRMSVFRSSILFLLAYQGKANANAAEYSIFFVLKRQDHSILNHLHALKESSSSCTMWEWSIISSLPLIEYLIASLRHHCSQSS